MTNNLRLRLDKIILHKKCTNLRELNAFLKNVFVLEPSPLERAG
jgi:hypothetical protein